MAVPFASLPAGGQLKAFFARVLGIPGREDWQPNYDCSRLGSRRAEGKYDSTVLECIFVVPFCHCPGRSKKAVWVCVGKVRASHFRSVVLSL